MKNLTCILLLFLAIPLTSLAQKDSIIVTEKEQPSFKNQIDLDVESIAISLGYKFRISNNWLVGPNFGLGPVVSLGYNDHSKRSGWLLTEIMHIGIVLKKFKFNKTNRWSFEAQTRLGLSGWDEGEVFYTFNFGGSIYYGGKVQIGVRTAIGKIYNISSGGFFSSNLILRLPLKTSKVK